MDYNVNNLLEKYWTGDSNLEEEQFLRDYFKKEEIDPKLEKYRSLFLFFGEEKALSMKRKIEAEQLDKATTKSRTISIRFWRAAAAIALLLGLFSIYQKVQLVEEPKAIVWQDTFDTEEEALAKTKEILLLVSRKMKQGTDKAAFSLGKAQLATGMIKEMN